MVFQRHFYIGLGVVALAAAIAIPLFAYPRWSSTAGYGRIGSAASLPGGGPVSLDDAVSRVKAVLVGSAYADLLPEEIMEFSNHFYVVVVEKRTGMGAMELIVLRNGVVQPEPGPNMMWNTKYGHMRGLGGMGCRPGGMMGWGWRGVMGTLGSWGTPSSPQLSTLTKEQARQIATQYLASAVPGATPNDGTGFFGYFTFDIERGGTPLGMLSVNAYTGQVWYHTWHGVFIQKKQLPKEE